MSKRARRRLFVVLVASAAAIPCSLLLGHSTGVIPGKFGIPANVTTGYPACGGDQISCHSVFANARPEKGKVVIKFTTPVSFQSGTTIKPSVTVTGGINGPRAGFVLGTSSGKLAGGTNTWADTTGRFVTHKNALSRTWTFSFTSAATGLVKWHMISNTVNGNGRADPGDTWGWFGPDSSIPGTPFRLFANDSKVFTFGDACKGSKGFKPLVGISKNASVGQSFPFEVHNIPPGVLVISTLGASNAAFGVIPLPLALTPFGAPGCSLRVSMDFLQARVSSGAGDGNGVASFSWTLPPQTVLRGHSLYLQALVFDTSGNNMGLTTSMGLRAVIQ